MRFGDRLFRQGHLAEAALMQALLSGDRPAHLDACELCLRRAHELGRWLDETRQIATEAVDEAFPAERLAAQHSQILRRLAQMDEPAQVIQFPKMPVRPPVKARKVAAGWLGVAAAAGLVVGVIGGQIAGRLDRSAVTPPAPIVGESPSALPTGGILARPVAPPSLLEMELDDSTPLSLIPIDARAELVPASFSVGQR